MFVEDNQENIKTCMDFCRNCPSYPQIEGEGLYCARGKSQSWIEKQGCLCSSCPVLEKYELREIYFCAEKEE